MNGNILRVACGKRSGAILWLVLVILLIMLPGIAGAEIVYPIENPCAGTTNIVADGGFEDEAGYYHPAACPCPLVSPWVVSRSGKGEAHAQTGWGDEGWYSAVLSLNDSAPGEWILLSQEVSGGQYCMLKFAWNTWLTNDRQGELSVYLDNVRIWRLVPGYQGKLPFRYRDIVNVSTFSGNHTLRFQWKVFNSSNTGHAEVYLDDIWLMAYPGVSQPVLTRQEETNPTLPRPVITSLPTTLPEVTAPPAFQPIQYLACLSRKIHDYFFSFIPLREDVSHADPGCV